MAQITDKQLAKLESLVVMLQEFLDSLRRVDVQLTPRMIARIERLRSENRCLYCELPLEGKVTRGVHAACYVLLNRRVNRGEITHAEVISNGWMDAQVTLGGRKPKRPDPMRGRVNQQVAGPAAPDLAADRAQITADLERHLEPEPGKPKKRRAKK